VPALARAAVAVGIAGVFIETHDAPDRRDARLASVIIGPVIPVVVMVAIVVAPIIMVVIIMVMVDAVAIANAGGLSRR
jgi:3-deoxy-D-manno-octulosonic acid (KDO) 8-phosphate synthase